VTNILSINLICSAKRQCTSPRFHSFCANMTSRTWNASMVMPFGQTPSTMASYLFVPKDGPSSVSRGAGVACKLDTTDGTEHCRLRNVSDSVQSILLAISENSGGYPRYHLRMSHHLVAAYNDELTKACFCRRPSSRLPSRSRRYSCYCHGTVLK
jgi:hypothetical protein